MAALATGRQVLSFQWKGQALVVEERPVAIDPVVASLAITPKCGQVIVLVGRVEQQMADLAGRRVESGEGSGMAIPTGES